MQLLYKTYDIWQFFFLWIVLYCLVAPFAAFNTSFDGSHFMQGSVLASLTWIIDDSVPLTCRLDRLGVLFCFINEKNLSSPALLWGITNTNRATVESSLNLSELSTFFMPAKLHPFCGTLFCQLLVEPVKYINTKIFNIEARQLLESVWGMASNIVDKVTWAPHKITSSIPFLYMGHDWMALTNVDRGVINTKANAITPRNTMPTQNWVYLTEYCCSSATITPWSCAHIQQLSQYSAVSHIKYSDC